jgi:murein DD-endopeptidase MepM/ murein hydrolase activator NlpD
VNKVVCIKPFGGQFRVSSPFGIRIDPITGEKKMHNGIDFACPEGTPIRAILDGKIMISGWENDNDHHQGYGLRIWQECPYTNKEKLLIVYAHLKEIYKFKGEWVDQSGIVGMSGNTGKSTGAHFHLGARIKDTGTFLDFEFEEGADDGPNYNFKEFKLPDDFNVKVYKPGELDGR